MIVLDTHAWLWWLSDPDQLSRRARNAIDASHGGAAVHISMALSKFTGKP